MPRSLALTLVALLAVGSLATVARGAGAAGRPKGSPDLAAMALATSDFPAGTSVDAQGYRRDPDFVATYEREFDVGGRRLGRTRLLYAYESLDVEVTPAAAKRTFDQATRIFRTKAGIQSFREFLAGDDLEIESITIGKIRRPAIGHGAIVIPIRIRDGALSFRMTVTLMRFDRVLTTILLLGVPGGTVGNADSDRLARVANTRIQAGLVPTSVAPPVISGIAQPGQTLTTSTGSWTGDQLTYEYQWERCLPPGTGCTPIPGATTPSYTVATGDLASSLRISVTGRNRLGTAVSSSMPGAAVVGPPGSPVSTAPPAIVGTPAVGATLTATTGTWTGDPTAFAYQWRRCDANGACPDIPGATASTYVVTTADTGSSLRVLVVAANAAGPGGSISPPSPTVP